MTVICARCPPGLWGSAEPLYTYGLRGAYRSERSGKSGTHPTTESYLLNGFRIVLPADWAEGPGHGTHLCPTCKKENEG